MIVYALLFWAFVGADFAWTFFWVGTTGLVFATVVYFFSLISSISDGITTRKEIACEAVCAFILQMLLRRVSFLWLGLYFAIAWLIQSI